ncbi:hypothetical protein ABPG72_006430 [Tetrahymena utriculariae]
MTDQNFLSAKEEGRSYLQKKEYEKAIQSYLKCLTFEEISNEELSILNLNIGICYMSKGNLEDSQKFIEKSISYNPNYQKAHYRKIQCLFQMGKLQESLNLCRYMIKQHPDILDFQTLIKQIQEKIQKEQSQSISWGQFSEVLENENVTESSLKETLFQIQSKIELRGDHKNIFFSGGFIDQFLKNSSSACKNNSLALNFILNSIFKITEEDNHFQLSYESIPFILQIFKDSLKDFKNEKNQKVSLDSLRILQYSDILVSGESILDAIQSSKCQEEIMCASISILSSWYYNNINYYLQLINSQISVQSLSDKLQSLMDWTASKLKSSKKGDILYKQFLQLLFKLQFKLNPLYLDKKYFYRKDKLAKTDMILIQEMLISSYEMSVQKVIENDLQRCLFTTYLRKPADIVIIDCILSIYSILLKEQKFVDKVMEDIAFQDFNIQIQKFLSSSQQELTYIIKYGLLLFKTNKQKQLPELVSFLRIFSFSEIFEKILFLTNENQFSEALEFIGFMSCFDQFKVEFIEASKGILKRLSLKVNFDIYEQGLNWLITISNLCFDQLKDYESKQKDRFGLSEDKLVELKQFEEKYRPDEVKQAKEIFRYNEDYIKKKQVSKILLEDVGIIKYLSQYITKSGKNQSNMIITYLAQLLSKLIVLNQSQSNQIDKNLFDKNLIIYSSRAVNQISQQKTNDSSQIIIQFTTYISKLVKDCNPNIFQYSEVHLILDALFKGIKESQHELLTFEILLSLVQMTSLGEQTTTKLVNTETLNLLQNLLMEDKNYYIVHGALEVINNICLNDKMMERIGNMSTLQKLIFAHFDYCYELLLKQKPEEINNSYDQPIKIINTIYNILAINASNQSFKEKILNHICSKPDTIAILLQKYSKSDGYIRMEFLYKFIFMTESIRGKKFSVQEKQIIKKMYDEIKEQYKKECNGVIPKNDTRFEYMNSIVS